MKGRAGPSPSAVHRAMLAVAAGVAIYWSSEPGQRWMNWLSWRTWTLGRGGTRGGGSGQEQSAGVWVRSAQTLQLEWGRVYAVPSSAGFSMGRRSMKTSIASCVCTVKPWRFVEAARRAAPEDVQPDDVAGGVRPGQQGPEDGRPQTPALERRGEVEVLQPEAVLGRAQGDTAREGAGRHDDRRVPRGEAVPQALSDPVFVVTAQPLQVRAHHHGPKFRYRLDIRRPRGADVPFRFRVTL